MIWPFLPLIAAYAIVALLVWLIGGWMVGMSAAGQRARLAVAIGWLPVLIVLASIGTIAAAGEWLDRRFERAADEVFGDD